MPGKKDPEIYKILRDTLTRMEEDAIKYEARRIKKLWKQVELPMSLKDCLLDLTKYQLDNIRHNLDIKNVSALNKNELAEHLALYQSRNMINTLRLLDKGRFQLLQKIARSGGYIVCDGFGFDVTYFVEHCLAFCGTMDGQRVMFMPDELLRAFQAADNRDLAATVSRNTDWINLTCGALYYYGIMDIWVLADRIGSITKQTVDFKRYYSVIAMASDFYQQIKVTAQGIMDERVDDPKELKAAIKKHDELDYYPFSKRQLLDASDSDFFERTPVMKKLAHFLINNYGFTKNEADYILLEISDMIMMKCSTQDILELLLNFIEIPDSQTAQILADLVTSVFTHTRMWELKGHTPYELIPDKQKHRNPEVKSQQANAASVYSLRTGAKIGRNDPCPCGSGKKYKKCCGA